MKKVKKENGWDEVVTTRVRFDGFSSKYFLQCKTWWDTPRRKRGAVRCQYCGKKWDDCEEDYWTSLVQTTDGNKVLCVDCFDDFGLENTGMSEEKRLKEYEDNE